MFFNEEYLNWYNDLYQSCTTISYNIHNFQHGELRVSSVCKKRDSFKAEKYVQ